MKTLSICLSAVVCCALVSLNAARGEEPLAHTKETLPEVKKNVAEGKAVIVDVREQSEWDAGHLKGAILLPQSKLRAPSELSTLLQKLPKDKVIYTHCGAGRRALACGEILKQHGYDVRPLKPGFRELVEAGFETADEKK